MTRGKYVVPEKKSKYKAVRCEVDGIKFDSKKEAKRWGELRMYEKAGVVKNIQRQVRFDFEINGVKLGFYKADFVYFKLLGDTWFPRIEDVKSEMTRKLPVYRLKKKLMKAIHGVDVCEV